MTSPIPPPSTELAPFALRLGILVLPTFGLRILFGRIALGLRFMSAGKGESTDASPFCRDSRALFDRVIKYDFTVVYGTLK